MSTIMIGKYERRMEAIVNQFNGRIRLSYSLKEMKKTSNPRNFE